MTRLISVFALFLGLLLVKVNADFFTSIGQGLRERFRHRYEPELATKPSFETFGIHNQMGSIKSDTNKPLCIPKLGCFINAQVLSQCAKYPNAPCTVQFLSFPQLPEKIDTKFVVFTQADLNTPIIIDPNVPETLTIINPKKRVVIFIHGFQNKYDDPSFLKLKDSLLKYTNGEVGTVIMVDWRKGAFYDRLDKNLTSDLQENYLVYDQACSNTQLVGRQTGYLIKQLKEQIKIVPEDKVYLIGYSLGAHASGYAGKWIQREYKFNINRITGLEAAGPLFLEGSLESRLNWFDAPFVDAVHTTTYTGFMTPEEQASIINGHVGFSKPYASVDFYINNAKFQPYCPEPPTTNKERSCKHKMAVLYFEASLSGLSQCSFSGFNCSNWDEFVKSGDCTKHNDTDMGYWADVKRDRVGVRYLAATKNSPFCKQ